ncbi:RNA polymerase II transcription factor B 52 kDa subunit [Borealophlyctis nickersoniae]|nr:RNA polymerase II transcription factor B 52 kDa subunit [Borealophlyctis nickersoniae]
MHICNEVQDNRGVSYLKMNETFQANFRNALVGGGDHSSFGAVAETPDKRLVTIDFLDKYASEAWEKVLHYLVGTLQGNSSGTVRKIMSLAGLKMETDSHSSDRSHITSRGFQFLLLDVHTQVWTLLLKYLDLAEGRLGMKLVDVLNFIFQLGSLDLGQDYSVDTLTTTQSTMMDDLKDIGLVYRRKKSSRFYPTRLATSLTSGNIVTTKPHEEGGFIIVETNYRVYAYTDSPLQIAVLDLFLALQTRFANMVVGQLTRDKVRDAFTKGITAEQIITFLTTHAHPEMRKQCPILPATIIDQIRLWEMEKNRLRQNKGLFLHDFAKKDEYQRVLRFASERGSVLWQDDSRRKLFIAEEGVAQVKEFMKQARKG